MFKDLPLSHSKCLSMTVKVQHSLAVALSSPQCLTPFPRLPTGFPSLEASVVCLYQSSHSPPSSQYVFAFKVVTALNAFPSHSTYRMLLRLQTPAHIALLWTPWQVSSLKLVTSDLCSHGSHHLHYCFGVHCMSLCCLPHPRLALSEIHLHPIIWHSVE